jgi:hypothetical protein
MRSSCSIPTINWLAALLDGNKRPIVVTFLDLQYDVLNCFKWGTCKIHWGFQMIMLCILLKIKASRSTNLKVVSPLNQLELEHWYLS